MHRDRFSESSQKSRIAVPVHGSRKGIAKPKNLREVRRQHGPRQSKGKRLPGYKPPPRSAARRRAERSVDTGLRARRSDPVWFPVRCFGRVAPAGCRSRAAGRPNRPPPREVRWFRQSCGTGEPMAAACAAKATAVAAWASRAGACRQKACPRSCFPSITTRSSSRSGSSGVETRHAFERSATKANSRRTATGSSRKMSVSSRRLGESANRASSRRSWVEGKTGRSSQRHGCGAWRFHGRCCSSQQLPGRHHRATSSRHGHARPIAARRAAECSTTSSTRMP